MLAESLHLLPKALPTLIFASKCYPHLYSCYQKSALPLRGPTSYLAFLKLESCLLNFSQTQIIHQLRHTLVQHAFTVLYIHLRLLGMI